MAATLRCEIFPADLDATADFYTRVLGFRVARDMRDCDAPYLALERDEIKLGASRHHEKAAEGVRRPPAGVELVVEVDDLDDERARVEAAGWPVDAEISNQPWGLRDFRILDPDGYYWRITSR